MQNATSPVRQFYAENVIVSVFRNDTSSNGKERSFYSVSCRQSYLTKGKWKYTATLSDRSLLTASMLLDLAYAWIVEQRQKAHASA